MALAVAGMVGIRQITADREAADGRASIGAVSLQARAGQWVNTDHDMTAQPGFQMPSAMMPGMPTGDDARLSIPATFTNTAGESVRFNPVGEFVLRQGEDVSRGLIADSFGEIHRIVADSAVNGLLYFDVPAPQPGDPPFYLEWRRDGRMVRLPVTIGGAAPEGHGH